MSDLPAGPYDVILCDPPWPYDDSRTRASVGAARSAYPCPPLRELSTLRVDLIAATTSVLAMWWTGPKSKEARDLAEAWGFEVVTMKLFSWVKLRPAFPAWDDAGLMRLSDVYKGIGHYTQGNTEDVLLGVKGSPRLRRVVRDVSQVVIAPRGRHSAKPPEVRTRLERLFGDVRRVELFARETAPGWTSWGDELP